MPTPRAHGGAAIAHIPMTTPGFMGLNTQQASGLLGPEWATTLQNAVLDDNGRVAARKGFSNLTSTSIASPFVHMAEYVKSDGTTELVGLTASNLVYKSTDGGSTWSAPTGAPTITVALDSRFQNFNNLLILFTSGQKPISYNGTALSQVTDVNAPTTEVGLAAFGRLWGVASDGRTLKYSSLLDHTNWTSGSAGSVDMGTIWTGMDKITAIAAFNGALVVFAAKHIVMFTDGAGSALGINPTSMYVFDTITGTGCLSQHSLQTVDGDLWFVSEVGLQSLGRLIQEKSNPIDNLSKNVQDYLTTSINAANLSRLRSAYSPKDRVYLLSLPSGTVPDTGRCFVFDTRGRLEDRSARCMGIWTLVPWAMSVRRNTAWLMQIPNANVRVGQYTGQLDDSASYIFDYRTGWLDLSQDGFYIFPKRFSGVFFSDNAITITFAWAFDFSLTRTTNAKTFTGAAGGGEWGSSEWSLAEFGGGVNLRTGAVPGSKNGKYVQLGISAQINNTVLAVQQLDLYAKIGRYA